MMIPMNLQRGDTLGTATILEVTSKERPDHNGRRRAYELRCECGKTTTRTRESLTKAAKRNVGIYCQSCAQRYKHCKHENLVRLPGQEAKYVKMKDEPKRKPADSRFYTINELKGLHNWGYAPR